MTVDQRSVIWAHESSADPFELVRLAQLMQLAVGDAAVAIGLLDGPVAVDHPELNEARIRSVTGGPPPGCNQAASPACVHGTFVASVLVAGRASPTPGICPGCTLVVRSIFGERRSQRPVALPHELAAALVECVDAGSRVLNLSVAVGQASPREARELEASLDYARSRGAIVVAAAGNDAAIETSPITRHPVVIPVVAYDANRRVAPTSNLAPSFGRRGLGGPGQGVRGLKAGGGVTTLGGTSAATPFVTGTVALLWSAYPGIDSSLVKWALIQGSGGHRKAIMPPLLDAWAGYEALASVVRERARR